MKKIIHDLSLTELKRELETMLDKMPRYRAEQVFSWINDYVTFDEMTNIPQDLRNLLKEHYEDQPVKIQEELISKDGTRKYLFALDDGNIVEGVLMQYKYGNTICISTQVGCRMGCAFCATGIDGLIRNLTAGEMLGEVLAVNHHIGGTKADRKITNIVLMGCGEPLDNYDNVVKFIQLISNKEGLNVSQRNISLSTCGLADKIKRLADEDLGITLTISLHASNDDIRKKIMRVNQAYPLKELFFAIKYYFEKTKRRIVFEYIELDNGEKFTIRCLNYSPDNKFIQSARLNGKPLDRCWFTHKELVSGGELEFVMGDRPQKEWASQDTPPTSLSEIENL